MDGSIGQAVRKPKLDARGNWLLQPGDKVQRIRDGALVLTVAKIEGGWITCEYPPHTIPADEFGPEKVVTDSVRCRNWELTPYNPAPLPKPETIEIDIRGLSAVALLELKYDGPIPADELRAAEKEDAARVKHLGLSAELLAQYANAAE